MTPWAAAALENSGSRAPESPIEIWTALIDGRLTLVDWYDADGRRFIVTRRNECVAQCLSHVERTVINSVAVGRAQKVVACELGLSAAAVSDALSRAIEKLGLSCVTELTRVAAALGVAR
jgi:DNA-binding NarL/FixJ family response regulator